MRGDFSPASFLRRLEARGVRIGLEGMRRFLRRLGDPQKKFWAVHVAGTNGKGSVAAMLHSVLRRAGLRVGLYTSPHLRNVRERIVGPDGRWIAAGEFRDLVRELADPAERDGATYFEFLTALAFLWFRRRCEAAVVEVGLGGRLDATHTLEEVPVGCVVTVGKDHEEYLGSRLARIAAEKAAILDRARVGVLGRLPSSAAGECRNALPAGRRLLRYGADFSAGAVSVSAAGTAWRYSGLWEEFPLRASLAGGHQAHNGSVAAACAEALRFSGIRIPPEAIRKGLAAARWPGRLQRIRLPIRRKGGWKNLDFWLDGAHNPAAAHCLARALKEIRPNGRLSAPRWRIIFGCLSDKPASTLLRILRPLAGEIFLVRPHQAGDRGRDPAELARLARAAGFRRVRPSADLKSALARLRKEPGGSVLITGSLYLVGEALKLLAARN